MGYNGAIKYIDEMDSYCSVNDCLFIVNDSELKKTDYNQTNQAILLYVTNNYEKIYASSVFGVYIS